MREQRFNKIKKIVFILLAVFLVISLTAASASAWYSKTSDGKCKEVAKEKVVKEAKEKPVKEVVKEKAAKKVAKEKVVKKAVRERVFDRKLGNEKLGNELLDMVENNWFGSGRGGNCDNGWGGDCDNGWFGDDWDDCSDC
ncbi:hypothetical protein [Methanosarcina sp. UBA5]|uniref:hypothetical protein n=1 Tax=Methanosarcina sp. UBA5 TaxID=1915593 RepID=UPI0025D9CCF7|nr:hypothetical protein [Methanosarcina sp. UBA5]